MASRLVLAVAGSGKTKCIIDSLDLTERSLILTYTTANYDNLKRRIIKKHGCLPTNIYLKTYFSFLYSFCYQSFLQDKLLTKGLFFERAPLYGTGLNRWISRRKYVYNNRLYQLIIDQIGFPSLLERLHRFFDKIYIDEIQDFSGHDFDFIEHLTAFNGEVLCVGDYYQHTFDTSTDGNKNRRLHSSLEVFIERCRNAGYEIDTQSLRRSWRCSPNLCEVVSRLGIQIESNRSDNSEVIRIDDNEGLLELCLDNEITKMFRQESKNFQFRSMNWAASKGINHFKDVCVILNNGTRDLWNSGQIASLNHRTKCKLYVAMTRARGTLYIADESHINSLYPEILKRKKQLIYY
jgi:superfamily I DNA/RNA helicase